MNSTAASVLWLALVGAEIAAVALAGRRSCSSTASMLAVLKNPSPDLKKTKSALLFALLAFAFADELAVEALHAWCFAGAPRPFAGWTRAGYHVETAIVTAWPALLAATCWGVFDATKDERPGINRAAGSRLNRASPAPWSARGRCEQSTGEHHADSPERVNGSARTLPLDVLLGAWIGLVVALAALYPLDAPGSGAPRTRAVLHTWEVLCVGGAWWGVWRGRARRWGRVEEALVIVAACETMVALVGPWASDPFTRWWIGRCFYLAAWSALVGVLARTARRV